MTLKQVFPFLYLALKFDQEVFWVGKECIDLIDLFITGDRILTNILYGHKWPYINRNNLIWPKYLVPQLFICPSYMAIFLLGARHE